MRTFVMLTRLSPEAVRSPHAFELLERHAMEGGRSECPQVQRNRREEPAVKGVASC
jgi:hypothetical protein